MKPGLKGKVFVESQRAPSSRSDGLTGGDDGRPLDHAKSAICYEEARRYIPGGVNSNFRLGMRPFPLFYDRANGSKLIDVDGNEYVDYALGMGPVILGHAHPAVTAAISLALAKGQLFAGQHEMELELARQICELLPCADMVRLSLSGSEAVQAALRLARAYTGRTRVIKFEGHYHGWLDSIYVGVRSNGVSGDNSDESIAESPGQDANAFAETRVLPWNDLNSFRSAVERQAGQIAAVIMEPVMCNSSVIVPRPGYLETVREICSAHGILLIFDEVITGFRASSGGAQQLLAVKPDLAIFAKAVANGYPLSGVAGRREIMEFFASKGVMHGGTYNTNIVSCAAGLATLAELRKSEGAVYHRMNALGTRLIEGLRQIAQQIGISFHVQGLPAVFHTSFTSRSEITDGRSYRCCDLERQNRFVRLLLDRGVIVTGRGTWFLSSAHDDQDIDRTLEAAKRVLQVLHL